MFEKRGLFNKIKNVAEQTIDTAKNVVSEQKSNYEEGKKHPLKIDAEMQQLYKQELTAKVQQQFSNVSEINVFPSTKEFTLEGAKILVPENQDAFNSYRNIFRKLANEAVEFAKTEYNDKITDLNGFLNYYEIIYNTYLVALCQKALNVLISKNIWSVSQENFIQRNKETLSSGLEILNTVIKSIEQHSESNKQLTSSILSIGTNFLGAKMSTNTGAFANQMLSAYGESIINSSEIKISYQQQQEIYQKIEVFKEEMFDLILGDYVAVCVTLIKYMVENDLDIWMPDNSKKEKNAGLFQNLSNPNFPKEKIPEALSEIILASPYDEEYYRFIISKYGKTDEVLELLNYFDCSNIFKNI